MTKMEFKYRNDYYDGMYDSHTKEVVGEYECIDSVFTQFAEFLIGCGFSVELVKKYINYDQDHCTVYEIDSAE